MTIIAFFALLSFIIGLLLKSEIVAIVALPFIIFYILKYQKKEMLIVILVFFGLGYLLMPTIKEVTLVEYAGEVQVVKVFPNYLYVKDENNNKYIIYECECQTKGCILAVNREVKEVESKKIPLISDFKDYLLNQGIKYEMVIHDYQIIKQPVDYLAQIKKWATKGLSSESQEFINLLVFGDKSDSIDIYDNLKTLSIVQLFVISGFHINLLYAALDRLLGKIIKNKLIIVGLILPYVIVLNFAIPALRALLMLFFFEINKRYCNGRYNKFCNLFWAAFICLLINPYNIYSYSFILTFVICFNLYLLSDIKCLNKKIKTILTPALLYLGIVPFLLLLNYEMNLMAVIYNSLFSLLIPPLYLGSIIMCLIKPIEAIMLPIILGFETAVQYALKASIILIMGKPALMFIVVYYVTYYYAIYSLDIRNKVQTFGALTYLIILLCFKYYEPYLYNNAQVTFLNVDQGDCTIISFPFNSLNVMVDTGGSLYTDYATKRIIPYLKAQGIKRLDYVIISHDDFDHNGAFKSLNSNYIVDNLVEGNRWDNIKKGPYILTNINKISHDNDNDNSSVVVFELLDKTFLLTGDISDKVEAEISDSLQYEIDVLKVSHHGSATATSDLFLQKIKPKLAIISVGKNNHYGHPSAQTLARLFKNGVFWYRTDRDGSVVIEQVNDFFLSMKK